MKWKKSAVEEAADTKAPEAASPKEAVPDQATARRKAMYDQSERAEIMRRRNAGEAE
jgi:hypothetical protein